MQSWTKAVLFGAVSAAAIAATYTRAPESDFAGAGLWYNITFYLPLVIVSFVCWVAAVCFYIAFMRQRASRSFLGVALPAFLLLPFLYETLVIMRYLLWLRHHA